MSNQARAQRLRRARERKAREAARIEREDPKYIHERLDLVFDCLIRIEAALKHTDSKAQTAVLRIANLQHRIDTLADEHKRVLNAVRLLIHDPQGHRNEEATILDQAFQNAKTIS